MSFSRPFLSRYPPKSFLSLMRPLPTYIFAMCVPTPPGADRGDGNANGGIEVVC